LRVRVHKKAAQFRAAYKRVDLADRSEASAQVVSNPTVRVYSIDVYCLVINDFVDSNKSK